MNEQERLLKFLDEINYTKNRLETEMKWGKGFINKMNRLTEERLNALCFKFPELSKEWLVNGTGEMKNIIREEQPKETETPTDTSKLLEIIAAQQKTIDRLNEQLIEFYKCFTKSDNK